MRLDFFVKFKYEASTIIKYILCVTNFVTSLTICLTRKLAMCVTYGKWCQRSLWHQLAF